MSSQQRPRAGTLNEPHSISLKVLRLSRPTLATQTPLGTAESRGLDIEIPATASLAYPSGDVPSSFPLTPLLRLPATFGAAYVGETFTCALCANNELSPKDIERSASKVSITAELQMPLQQEVIPLKLEAPDGRSEVEADIAPGASLQHTFRHELKEEGPHVLIVTVTYTETHYIDGAPDETTTHPRTFRKMYQFAAQPIIAVRSKITARNRGQEGAARQWLLEAQLENVGETSVVLERTTLREHDGICQVKKAMDARKNVVLKPQDVEQLMFLLEQVDSEPTQSGAVGSDSRQQLAQVSVAWRTSMGEPGHLTTGWLTSRAA